MSTDNYENNCAIGKRLKEEREKKAISQESLANFLGASKRTVVNWERGTSYPDARQLFAMSEAPLGFDVYYVVTGIRMPMVANEDPATYRSDAAQTILEALSVADDNGRTALLSLSNLIKSKHAMG